MKTKRKASEKETRGRKRRRGAVADRRVTIRLTADEYAGIRRRSAGLSVSEHVRRCVLASAEA